MAKQSGMGDNLLIGGSNLSNDIGAIDTIEAGRGTQEVTGIDKYAKEQILLLADPKIEYTGFFNPERAHIDLSALPTSSVIVSYLRGTTQGGACATISAKQVDYPISRGTDGSMSVKVSSVGADGLPLSWGNQLTAGEDDFTAAASTSSVDLVAASTGGYFTVHCTEFTGTNVSVKLEDSANNSTWGDVDVTASTTFTDVGAVRIGLASTVGVDRYVRADISGTFTTCTLAILFGRGEVV